NIGKGEQFKREFLAFSPNNRIPAMVDHDPPGGGAPIQVFESGAMLVYLAEKTGKYMPGDLRGRTEVMQWLFWQMGNLGPKAGEKQPLQPVRGQEPSLGDRPLPHRGKPPLRRAQSLPRRPRVRGRRLLHRRHGELSVDRSLRAPGAEAGRFPAREALVR